MGVNLDTGNFGFITNYENQQHVGRKRLRRAHLLLDFLKDQRRF